MRLEGQAHFLIALKDHTPGVSQGVFVPYDDEFLLKLRTRAKLVAKRVGLIEVEAEDVAQNALLALIQNRDVLSPNAWVTTIALRGAQGVIRSRIRNTRLADRAKTEWELISKLDRPWDLLPDLAQALECLGPLEMEIFLSQELGLCTWTELSVQTGRSVSTLKRRLRRTRQLIRRKLAPLRTNIRPPSLDGSTSFLCDVQAVLSTIIL